MQRLERTLAFPGDSPCLEGHFPGNPVVPAVAILAELIDWTEKQVGQKVAGVRNARFQKPLFPGVSWDVTLENRGSGEATLTAREGGAVTLKARLILGEV